MVEYIKTANNASSYPTKTVVANPIPIIAVDSTILFAWVFVFLSIHIVCRSTIRIWIG